jgi:NADPH:quinone reductase-like Zn-dependent oxidoreductase
VLIGVEHAPINMNDLYLIQGVYPVRPSLPSVVGNEGVGRVLAIGSDIADDAVTRAGAVGLAIAATAVGGMFFCVLRRRSDSTLAPIVAHTSMNSLGVFASAIAP